MPDTAPSPNIYQRINAVRAVVKRVAKEATIKAGGESYKAVTHDDVTDALRDAMVEHGIVRLPTVDSEARMLEVGTTQRGTTIWRYEARFRVDYVNVDNPDDRVTTYVDAHANDMGDKAPGKALSYATKYGDLKVFGLATGENEEERIEATATTRANDRLLKHNGALRAVLPTVLAVKEALAEQDIDRATECWAELTRPEETALWLAPSKGGIWTTEEREQIKDSTFTARLKERRTDAGWYDNPENAT